MQAWSEYSRFVIALFSILTPFAAIPTFLSLTEGQGERARARIARTAVFTIAVLLISSAFLGDSILRLIGTSLASFRVGGGLVLLLMALAMMNARISPVQQTREEAEEAAQMNAIGVVPIGMPLLAGPGSISTVIIQMERNASLEHHAAVIGCILFVCGLVWGVLALATPIGERLGRTGLNVLNRLFVAYGFLGLVIPATMVLSMDAHGPIAGTASALGGTLHFVAGIAVMAMVSPFANGDPVPMLLAIAGSAVVAFGLAVATPACRLNSPAT